MGEESKQGEFDTDIKRVLRWVLGLALACAIASLVLPIWSLKSSYSGGYHVDLFSIGALVSGSGLSFFGLAGFRWLTELSSSTAFALAVFIGSTLAIIFPLLDELMIQRRKDPEAIKIRIDTSLLVAGLMSLVSPLVFSFLLPNSMNSAGTSSITYQFWYSSVGLSYGANVGWYLQFLTFFLIVFSIIVIYLSRTTPTSPVDSQKQVASSLDVKSEIPSPSQEPVPEPGVGRPPILLCGNCRKEIPADSNLCPYCGTEVKR